MVKFEPTVYSDYDKVQFRFLWWSWAAILLIIATDAAIILLGGWKVNTFFITAKSGDLIALALCAVFFHKMRFPSDVIIFTHLVALCIILPTSGLTLSYLLASIPIPLNDDTLVKIDNFFGFDWLTYIGWLNEHPQIAKVLTFAYDSMVMQISLVMLVLCFANRVDQAQRFVGGLILTSFITIVLAAIFPALGTYTHYNINLEDYHNLKPAAAYLHKEGLLGLRDGTLHTIGINMQGIVTFPSFHTVIAVLIIYACWPVPYLRWLVAAWNVLMVISTMGDGGHYLSDVMGGIMVALVAIFAMQKLLPQPPVKVSDK